MEEFCLHTIGYRQHEPDNLIRVEAKITGSAQKSSHFAWRRNSLVMHSCTGGGEGDVHQYMAVQCAEERDGDVPLYHSCEGGGDGDVYQCQSFDDNNQSEPGWEVWPC
jgi:hypothetical protein